MNAIAWLGRLVIERVRGIGDATVMLLQIIFSLPSAGGFGRFIYQMYRVGVCPYSSSLYLGYLLGLFLACRCITFW